MLKWAEGPDGQHIELGISEMNLFLLLGQLGLAWDLSDQPLLPVGTVYDPFVLRGLDAFIYSVYSGARFIVAGTPSGVTLAPEGGAHQSTITASVGLELPSVTFIEPAYAVALDWLLCGALQSVAAAGGRRPGSETVETGSYYFRLTTRGIDQQPFQAARERLGDAILRRQVLAGGYRLVDASEAAAAGAPPVYLVGCGAVLPEVLTAAAELADEGIAATVVESPPLTGCTGPGSAPCGRACAPRRRRPSPARCAALSRPGAARHRARRGLAHDELARLSPWRPGRQPRRRQFRPVRHGRRPLPGARP